MKLTSSLSRIAMAVGLLASVASATPIDLTATGTNTSGRPVSASASFTMGEGGVISIILGNRQWNPTDASQLLTDLWFTIDGISSPSGTLSSITGTEVSIGTNKTGSEGATGTVTGWQLNSWEGGLHLVASTANHWIIGPSENGTYTGTYSNAKSSIAGNSAHNPFLESGATFLISNVIGVNENSKITNASFSFGSGATEFVLPVEMNGGGGGSVVPEPVSFVLMGVGLLAIGIVRRRR